MTFSPSFAFYRDDRALDAEPPLPFWDEMKVEAGIMAAWRRVTYPKMAMKGRISRTDADREIRVARALAEDWGAAPWSGKPIATWAEIVHALRREITLRRNRFPQVQGDVLDAAEADRRLLLLEHWHDMMWHSTHPDARDARHALDERRAA